MVGSGSGVALGVSVDVDKRNRDAMLKRGGKWDRACKIRSSQGSWTAVSVVRSILDNFFKYCTALIVRVTVQYNS